MKVRWHFHNHHWKHLNKKWTFKCQTHEVSECLVIVIYVAEGQRTLTYVCYHFFHLQLHSPRDFFSRYLFSNSSFYREHAFLITSRMQHSRNPLCIPTSLWVFFWIWSGVVALSETGFYLFISSSDPSYVWLLQGSSEDRKGCEEQFHVWSWQDGRAAQNRASGRAQQHCLERH